jgi:hypothetical protein
MKKLVLLSVIILSIAIPTRASKHPNARAGLKKVLVSMLVVDALYLFALMYIWPRLE